jgi:chromosome segregation ATPase
MNHSRFLMTLGIALFGLTVTAYALAAGSPPAYAAGMPRSGAEAVPCLLAPTEDAAKEPSRDLGEWRLELEQRKQALEKEFEELIEERSLLEMKEKSLQPGEDPAPIEAEIEQLNQRVQAYETRRATFQSEVEAYNDMIRRQRPEIKRERVVYQGPEAEQADGEQAAKADKPASAAGGGFEPTGNTLDEKAASLEKKREDLDAEYQRLLAEKEAIMAEKEASSTEEEIRKLNDKITAFNSKLKDYESRRKAFNDTVVRFNEEVDKANTNPQEGQGQ